MCEQTEVDEISSTRRAMRTVLDELSACSYTNRRETEETQTDRQKNEESSTQEYNF